MPEEEEEEEEEDERTHTDIYIYIKQSSVQTFQAHTLKQGGLCLQKKLTRLASKQASESVINLFSLAPRSRGRGLIGGRGLFCAELCMQENNK